MNEGWRAFLMEQGAKTVTDESVCFDGSGKDKSTIPAGFITPLPGLTLLEITGKDAASFLHGQLTSDLNALISGGHQLSAWCNAKGRVIATFYIYRLKDSYLILLPASLADKFRQRLQMYILRSEVSIHQLEGNHVMIGIHGEGLVKGLVPNSDSASIYDSIYFLPLPEPSTPRLIAAGPAEKIQALWKRLTASVTAVDSDYWHLLDIEAVIPWLSESTSERFLPQELNLEQLGGLSYDKGCYPGQEVIARVHYRGKVKQQLLRASVAGDPRPAAGTPLYGEETEQELGTVLHAVPLTAGTYSLLAVANVDYALNKPVHLQKRDGPVLEFDASVSC